jgi:hypothetical protein
MIALGWNCQRMKTYRTVLALKDIARKNKPNMLSLKGSSSPSRLAARIGVAAYPFDLTGSAQLRGAFYIFSRTFIDSFFNMLSNCSFMPILTGDTPN